MNFQLSRVSSLGVLIVCIAISSTRAYQTKEKWRCAHDEFTAKANVSCLSCALLNNVEQCSFESTGYVQSANPSEIYGRRRNAGGRIPAISYETRIRQICEGRVSFCFLMINTARKENDTSMSRLYYFIHNCTYTYIIFVCMSVCMKNSSSLFLSL